QPRQIADPDLAARADVDRIRTIIPRGGESYRSGRVLHVEELPARRAGAPDGDTRLLVVARLDHLPDQRRDDVAGAGIEVVARSVEIREKQIDRVEAIFPAVGLRLHEQHLLCQAVWRIGLFGISVPETALLERNGRELRVSADGAHRHE